MGAPMATRLVEAGHQVVVWNRAPAKSVPLIERGATVAATPAAATATSEVAITMLAGASAVRDVLTGVDGVLTAPPATLIQMSTVSPAELSTLAALAGPQGPLRKCTQLLDAPVLGSVPHARTGRLRILVGGSARTFEHSRHLLSACGEPVHVGPAGSASALKLVLNAAVAPMVAQVAESLALADAFGLDRRLVLDELVRSRVGPLVERKRIAIESGHFPADSRLDLFVKDMCLVVESGQAFGLEMRMTRAAKILAEAAVDAGLGQLDYSVLMARSAAADPAHGFDQPPS